VPIPLPVPEPKIVPEAIDEVPVVPIQSGPSQTPPMPVMMVDSPLLDLPPPTTALPSKASPQFAAGGFDEILSELGNDLPDRSKSIPTKHLEELPLARVLPSTGTPKSNPHQPWRKPGTSAPVPDVVSVLPAGPGKGEATTAKPSNEEPPSVELVEEKTEPHSVPVGAASEVEVESDAGSMIRQDLPRSNQPQAKPELHPLEPLSATLLTLLGMLPLAMPILSLALYPRPITRPRLVELAMWTLMAVIIVVVNTVVGWSRRYRFAHRFAIVFPLTLFAYAMFTFIMVLASRG
jgi:hypothetical protein